MEAVAIMTSSAIQLYSDSLSSRASGGNGHNNNEMEQQQQREQELINSLPYQILSQLINCLLSQIDTLLQHAQLHRYADQIMPKLAHKLSCLASLSKPYSYKNNHYYHQYITKMLETKLIDVMIRVLSHVGQYPVIRTKALILQHRLVACVGVNALKCTDLLLLHFINSNSNIEDDIECIVALVNQLLIEFQKDCLPVLCIVSHLLLSKLQQLYDSKVNTSNTQSNVTSTIPNTNDNNDNCMVVNNKEDVGYNNIVEAPHIAVEKYTIMKLYMSLVQHICDNNCFSILFLQQNEINFNNLINYIISNLSKWEYMSPSSSTQLKRNVPIIRCTIISLTSVIKGFYITTTSTILTQMELLNFGYINTSYNSISSFDNGASNNTYINTSNDYKIHIELLYNQFYNILYNTIIPLILQLLSDNTLNTNDAMTLSLIGDIAMLLYIIIEYKGVSDSCQYISSIVLLLQWPQHISTELLSLISKLAFISNNNTNNNTSILDGNSSYPSTSSAAVGLSMPIIPGSISTSTGNQMYVFKESFRKLIRNCYKN